MATLYIDFESGNNNYGGTSFNLLASGTNGRISSSTFSSSTASFPNDGSLINQYLSIFNGSNYVTYRITAWISSTSLTIAALSGGTALANQTVDRQFFIGGSWLDFGGATALRTIAGDEIRIKATPDPTSIGNATWTGGASPNTKTITTSTNASPISITCSNHGYSTGDYVAITGHLNNTNANGVWEITVTGTNTFTLSGSTGTTPGSGGTVKSINTSIVKLASPVTKTLCSTGNVGSGRTAWTAAANATTALITTTTKQGNVSDSILVTAAFTTGKAAYKTIPAVDLSGYTQLSFWIYQLSGTIGADNAISIRLCSDTTGDVPVNTFNIENLTFAARWVPITINLGTPLGNSIQSVAFYVNTDNGGQQFYISNVIACKDPSSADSLNLNSLISKNTEQEPFWSPIQSIDETIIFIDNSQNNTPLTTTIKGYYGTSETVTTYKREVIIVPMNATSTSVRFNMAESGTVGNPITYSGGWDRTNMTTQNSYTFLSGRNGVAIGLSASTRTYLNFNRLGLIRFGTGFSAGNSNVSISLNNCYFIGNATIGISLIASRNISITNSYILYNIDGMDVSNNINFISTGNYIYNNGSDGLILQYGAIKSLIDNNKLNNNTRGLAIGGSTNIIKNCTMDSNDNYGIFFYQGASDNWIYDTTISNSLLGGILCSHAGIVNYLKNCTIDCAVEFVHSMNDNDNQIVSINHDDTSGFMYIFTDGGVIQNSTTVRHADSGFSWSLSPTDTNRSSSYPLTLKVATIAVSADSPVTVKGWARKNTSSTLQMGLMIRGGQIAGVPSDISSYMTDVADTWEQVTLSFTPTESGVVEVLAACYGDTSFTGYVDDLSISQV
jgi:hypothetical protein